MSGNKTGTPQAVEMGSDEKLQAELKRLQAENEALKKSAVKGNRKFGVKVAEKGGVQIAVEGSRFPLTPYASDLMSILENASSLAGFVVTNIDKLSHGTADEAQVIKDERKAQTLARAKSLAG